MCIYNYNIYIQYIKLFQHTPNTHRIHNPSKSNKANNDQFGTWEWDLIRLFDQQLKIWSNICTNQYAWNIVCSLVILFCRPMANIKFQKCMEKYKSRNFLLQVLYFEHFSHGWPYENYTSCSQTKKIDNEFE